MKNKLKIIQQLKNTLGNEEHILFAYLHGSFLSTSNFNDIDIAIYLDNCFLKRLDLVDFELSLSVKIENIIRIPIDIKILNMAPLGFQYQITNGKLLFSKNELLRENFLCKTWDEYLDFQPISNIYFNEVLNGKI